MNFLHVPHISLDYVLLSSRSTCGNVRCFIQSEMVPSLPPSKCLLRISLLPSLTLYDFVNCCFFSPFLFYDNGPGILKLSQCYGRVRWSLPVFIGTLYFELLHLFNRSRFLCPIRFYALFPTTIKISLLFNLSVYSTGRYVLFIKIII